MFVDFDAQRIGLFLSYAALIILIVTTSYTDLRYRKIYNRHTVPSLIVGLFLAAIMNFPNGLWNALLASLLAFIVFFVMFAFGVMGGGDVKLAAAIGAFTGYPVIIDALYWGMMCGGVYAILSLLARRELLRTLKQLGIFVWNLLVWRIVAPPALKDSRKIPYGVCIATGTVIALVLRWTNHASIAAF